VLNRPLLRRLGAWFGRSHPPGALGGPSRVPIISRSGDDGVVPSPGPACGAARAEPTIALAPLTESVLDLSRARTLAVDQPPAPLAPHHERGLHMAEAHRWNWAQRELERAISTATDEAAAADLASVRGVRRQLRVLQKWPRDVPAHLALGRCYFELGLGADAEDTFRRVLTLAPDEPAAPYFLALEYAFRGEREVAEGYYARARALAPDLPSFADCLGEQGGSAGGDAAER